LTLNSQLSTINYVFTLVHFSNRPAACALRSHVQRLLAAQRDRLSPQATGAITGAMNELQKAIARERTRAGFGSRWMSWIPPPTSGSSRIRTPHAAKMSKSFSWRGGGHGHSHFFRAAIQNPTGSMQPTLFGVTAKNICLTMAAGDPHFKIPTGWERIRNGLKGFLHSRGCAKRWSD